MDDKTLNKFVEEAYTQAMDYADQKMKQCRKFEISYRDKNIFYKKVSKGKVMMAVLMLAAGICGISFQDKLFSIIEKNVYTKIDFGLFARMFELSYFWLCILIMGFGINRIAKLIYAVNVHFNVKSIQNVAKIIEKEKKQVKELKEKVLLSMETFEFPKIKNESNCGMRFKDLEKKQNAIKKRHLCILRVLQVLSIAAAITIAYLILPSLISEAIISDMCYTSSLVIIWAYMIITCIIVITMRKLFPLFKRWIKLAAMVILVGNQVLVWRNLKGTKALLPLFTGREIYKKSNNEFYKTVVDFLVKYLLSEGGIMLLLTSLILFFFFLSLNAEKENIAFKEGIEGKRRDGVKISVSAKRAKLVLILPMICTILYMLFIPFLMTDVLSYMSSNFLYIVVYIIFSIIWFFIIIFFTNSKLRTVYGMRSYCFVIAFFFGYILLTLSTMPEFGMKSIILLVMKPVVGLLALIVYNIIQYFN